MRLFGLADKVLVLDEAHAYDPYLAEEVATLLRFHAALGGSAVVLSATLTRTQWGALVDAWRDGVEGTRSRGAVSWGGPTTAKAPAREDGYPLATVVSRVPGADGVRQTVLKAASWSRRRVDVRFVRSAEAAVDAVVRAHAAGGAVAWIRNTVDECLETAATRLGDEQTTVRLARVQGDGSLHPWAGESADAPSWKRWALSEVRLSARRVPSGTQADSAYERAVAAVRIEWGRFEQELLVVPLQNKEGGLWTGELLRPDGRVIAIRYTDHEGLAFV